MDTAGQEKYNSIVSSYFKNADGAIVVFDLTNLDSFLTLSKWIEKVCQNKEEGSCPMVIVGNKLDLCNPENRAGVRS